MTRDVFWSGMEWFGLALVGWHLVAFVLCGLGLLLVMILGKQGPVLRSHILRSTLLGILFLPGFALIRFPEGNATAKSAEISRPEAGANPFSKLEWEKVAVWRPILMQRALEAVSPPPYQSSQFPWKSFFSGLSVLWLVLLGVGLMRLGRGMIRTATWITNARPCLAADRESCERMAKTIGIGAPRVLLSAQIHSPMVAGVFRPVLLLPENLTAGDEVWRHELSHIRHGDIFWNLMATGLAFCFPLQPLFSFLRRAMTEAAEERCDDVVLLQGGDRQVYAGLLVDLAERGGEMEVCSLPMARSSMLERRLTRFLDAAWLSRARTSRGIWLAALCLMIAGICGAGWVFVDMKRSASKGIKIIVKDIKLYRFSVHPVTEYWKKQGYNQRLVALNDGTEWGFSILSDKVASYLDSLPEKKVMVMVQREEGKGGKVISVGDIDFSKLAEGEVEAQFAIKATAHVDPVYAEASGKSETPAPTYDGTFKLEPTPTPKPAIAPESSGNGLKLRTDSPSPLPSPAGASFTTGYSTNNGKAVFVWIHKIEVEFAGGTRISKEAVISDSGIKLPENFQANTLKRVVKSLYATGKFLNIRAYDEPLDDGVKVVIIVEAAPIVTQIEWQGIDGTPLENLEALVKTHQDGTVSGYQLFEDAAALQKHFGGEKKVTAEFLSRNETKGTATVLFKVQ